MTILAEIDTNIVRYLGLALALVVAAATIEMIRRRKLREEYALLWLGTSVVMLVFAAFPQLVVWLSRAMYIQPVTTIVLSMFMFLSMIVMHFAIAISRQAEETRQLAQRMAILNEELRKLKEGSAPAPPPSGGPDAQLAQVGKDGNGDQDPPRCRGAASAGDNG